MGWAVIGARLWRRPVLNSRLWKALGQAGTYDNDRFFFHLLASSDVVNVIVKSPFSFLINYLFAVGSRWSYRRHNFGPFRNLTYTSLYFAATWAHIWLFWFLLHPLVDFLTVLSLKQLKIEFLAGFVNFVFLDVKQLSHGGLVSLLLEFWP